MAALLADRPHQAQGVRPLAEGGDVEIGRILRGVVGQSLGADAIHQVEPAAVFQALAQIGQHEADQALRLGALADRFVAGHQGRAGESGHHRHAGQGRRRHGGHLALAALGVTTHQFIKANAQHAGDELQAGEAAAIASGAQIGGDRLGTGLAVAVAIAHGRREAGLVGIVSRRARTAGDDRRQDAAGPMAIPKPADLLVDPAGGRGIG